MRKGFIAIVITAIIVALLIFLYGTFGINPKIFGSPTASPSMIPASPTVMPIKESPSPKSSVNPSPSGKVQVPVFKKQSIPLSIQDIMQGVTIHPNSIMKFSDLSYITVTYFGNDGKNHTGHIIMDKNLADETISIFKALLNAKFPIKKMVLPDVYGGVDELSMEDNNTSGFNDRPIDSSGAVSYHQLGRAIDINPLVNPYYKASTNDLQPKTAGQYLDRTLNVKGMIKANDICVRTFKSYGWDWGGDWRTLKDYQHFEKAK